MVKKNNKIIIDTAFLCLLFIFFIFLYIVIFKFNTTQEFFDIPTSHERPFVNVYVVKKNNKEIEQLKIVLLSHPFTRENSWKQYQDYVKDGFLILGITSYNEFPSITTNKLDSLHDSNHKAWKYDYMNVVKGWLHCFRNPEIHIKKNMPIALISESDFCNYDLYKPNNTKKIYDFIYVCPKDSENEPTKKKDCNGWGAGNKNWKLGKKCIEKLCGNYKLKGLLVGRKGCKLNKVCDNLITTTDFLSQDKLIESYNQSKFILMSNESDASPRVLTEALCCDLPVLVNYKILGGWKYINSKTGAFFKGVDDLKSGIDHVLYNRNELSPRQFFIDNYGEQNAGKKLKSFISKYFSNDINLNDYEYLKL